MVKKNDLIQLKINGITNLGFGVGRHDGMVIFCSDTVPGDEAVCRIIKVTPSYAIARCEELITPSPDRCYDRCGIATCKSCTYKLLSYERELKYKKELIEAAFMHEGLSDINVCDVIPSPSLTEYRNKAQYPISRDKNGEYVIGFFAPKSHRVTEARKCPLAPKIFSEIIDTATAFFKKHDISVYNEETGVGLLRHIYMRRAEVGGEVLFTLVINGKALPNEAELVMCLTEKHPEIVGVLINVNEENTNVIIGDEWRTLYGRDHIFDTLAGVRLKITAQSFYQVNRAAADILYGIGKELAAPTNNDTILDLFCGAGSIGLSMADKCGELVGIEIIDSAVECAKENAKNNGISHAKFYTGDANTPENLLKRAESELGKKLEASIIILDPPRSGCDASLIDYIATLDANKIVYISCNPITLARDVKRFTAHGFTCSEVKGVDLFPMTGHVESVVCLTRQSDVI